MLNAKQIHLHKNKKVRHLSDFSFYTDMQKGTKKPVLPHRPSKDFAILLKQSPKNFEQRTLVWKEAPDPLRNKHCKNPRLYRIASVLFSVCLLYTILCAT